MIDLEKRPLPAPGYHIETLDGELLLFHPAGQTILHTNQTGALVWGLCDGRRSIAEMIRILTAAYPEATTLTEDVTSLLVQLETHKAIIWS